MLGIQREPPHAKRRRKARGTPSAPAFHIRAASRTMRREKKIEHRIGYIFKEGKIQRPHYSKAPASRAASNVKRRRVLSFSTAIRRAWLLPRRITRSLARVTAV